MSDLRTTIAPNRVELRLGADSFPRDAVYAAAYTFIDRCWVGLRHDGGPSEGEGPRIPPGGITVVLRAKTASSFDGEALAAELRNELLGQAFRQRLLDEGRALTDAVVRGAFGGADSPAIDDLLAVGTALDDPLGIALSWEAQQKPEGEQGA